VRLLLISHAAVGAGLAPGGEAGLSPAARARAAEVGRMLPRPREAFTSPAVPARQTAEALGLAAAPVAVLGDRDADGGESLDDLVGRVAGWLALHEVDHGTRAAVRHVAVIRAAVLAALGASPAVFAAIDVAPCCVTELGLRDGAWHVTRVNWEPALLHIPQRRGRRRTKGST
jgi:broad specificity phosphatase PhoE